MMVSLPSLNNDSSFGMEPNTSTIIGMMTTFIHTNSELKKALEIHAVTLIN